VNQDPGEDGIDALMRFRSPGGDYGIPAIHIKRGPAERILAAGGLTAAATTDAESTEESADNRTPTPILTGLQRRIDEDAARVSGPLAGVTLRGHVAYEADEVTGRNVIGVLPGSGPHADEYVVIGAHYDHLGKRRGRVYNGADDNASGSAGVIELAWMLSATPERDRSVLLMTFAGEEIGLLGSRHYASEPTVEIDSITAMLNMDMIGRLSDAKANMLAIQGLGTGDAFKQIVARRTEEAGLKYLPDESSHGPSDHASFDRVGVPSLFFFTGVHEDYHQPGDDVEKINVEGAVRIVDLVRDIALDLINLDTAPQFAEVTSRPDIFRGAGPSRAGGVVMGIMPDMDDESDAPGWRVARVFPASGADKAGMKNGDRILRIEGRAINGFSDYSEVTRGKKPGDRLAVIVLRGGKELTLSVELSARGG
ncbi:MAG: M28 family peptidase, partial [Phycisphaerae bacterium]